MNANETTSSVGEGDTSAFLKLSDIKRPVLWAALAMMAAIILRSVLMGTWGHIGIDGDDVMRMVQIKDYLGGQNWFDTDQHRLGLASAGGTDMHWSRLVDLPIIALTQLFDLVLTEDKALMLAISVWPPLTAGLFIWAMMNASGYYAGGYGNAPEIQPKTFAFTLILLAFFVIPFYRFQPGAIDHHNVQMALVALALAGGLDNKARFKTHFVAGIAAALSVAIGPEVYFLAAAICAYMALSWVLQGEAFVRAAQGFGLGLAAALGLVFIATISPAEYGFIKCDSLSLITLSAGGAGGLGLALAAGLLKRTTLKLRLIGAALIGAACLLVFGLQAPQCLVNPYTEIPDDVKRIWLDQVSEARPLWAVGRDWLEYVPLTLGPALLALWLLGRQLKSDKSWSPKYLLLFLLLAAAALSVYQIRFNTFSYVISIIPLAAWVGELFTEGRAKAESSNNGSNIAYIGALALSIPLVWLLPAMMFGPKSAAPDGTAVGAVDASAAQVQNCYSDAVMEVLTSLTFGTIASTSNGGSEILSKTPQRALSGNYHRNIAGISAQIHLATSAPDTAYEVIKSAGVDYVHFCKNSSETNTLIAENKDGLYGQLKRENVPNYLEAVYDDGNVSIYAVK